MDASTHYLVAHEWAYGLTECVHIVSLALSVGMIAVVDLRLLGVGLASATPRQLMRDTGLWTVAGLVLVVTSGLLILSTDVVRYVSHPTMQLKFAVLVIAVLFNYVVRGPVARREGASGAHRLVAAISIGLWVTVVFSGIFYAFT